MRRALTGMVGLLATGTAAALLGGAMGGLHGAGDSLAVFRVPLAGLLLGLSILLAALGPARLGLLFAACAVASLATLLPHWVPDGTAASASTAPAAATPIRHYQKNLWVRLGDPEPLVADIRAAAADIVTLQEVRDRDDPVLAALAAEYPTQVRCPFARVGGVAVLSRFPAIPGTLRCIPGAGFVEVGLDTPSGPLRAISVHLHWPWPFDQSQQVQAILRQLGPWEGPTVMGGDFNMVRWSHALARLGAATGTAPVGPSRVTLKAKRGVLNLAIDHVLAPEGQGTTELRPTLGSDHNGLLAVYALPML